MEKVIIIKYAELSTKSDNINFFIKTLKHNIESLLQKETFSISSDVGRMIIYTENIPKVMEKLKTVFGIHEIMIGYIFKEKPIVVVRYFYSLSFYIVFWKAKLVYVISYFYIVF